MADRQRETVGYLLRSKTFLMYIFYFMIFINVTLIYTCGNFWTYLYQLSEWGTTGLIVGNFVGTLAMYATVFSWIIIDRNSWLGSAIIYAFVSVCLIVCSLNFMIQYFKGLELENEAWRAYYDSMRKNEKIDPIAHYHDDKVGKLIKAWMPALMLLNFFQGILSVIFSIYICISLDQIM